MSKFDDNPDFSSGCHFSRKKQGLKDYLLKKIRRMEGGLGEEEDEEGEFKFDNNEDDLTEEEDNGEDDMQELKGPGREKDA